MNQERTTYALKVRGKQVDSIWLDRTPDRIFSFTNAIILANMLQLKHKTGISIHRMPENKEIWYDGEYLGEK